MCFCEFLDAESLKYLKTAISAIANQDILSTEECSSYYNDIYTYDIVFINNEAFLSQEDFTLYVENGGHIIYLPNIDDSTKSIYFKTFDITAELADNEIDIMKSDIIEADFFESIFSEMREEKIFTINQNYFLPLNENSIIRVPNRGSLWNRLYKDRGVIDIFGIDMNILNNNLPLKGAFIPFVYSLITSHNKIHPSTIFLGESRLLESKNIYKSKSEITLTDNREYSKRFNHLEDVDFTDLEYPGFYYLNSNQGLLEQITVNVSPDEIFRKKINFNFLKQNYNNNSTLLSQNELEEFLVDKVNPSEIWTLFLALSIIFLLLESAIIHVFGRK